MENVNTIPEGYELIAVDPTSAKVLQAILAELVYQTEKYGQDKQQSFPGYVNIARAELNEADAAWNKNIHRPRHSALEEMVQVCATAFRCLYDYGVVGCPVATNDGPTYSPHSLSDSELPRSDLKA